MVRDAQIARALVLNGTLAGAAGPVTIDATAVTNGWYIANAEPERTILRVANTEGSTNVITIRAGDNPPGFAAGSGDYAESIAATSGIEYLGPFESARFLQDDGSMQIDFEAGMTGTVDILLIPRF